MSPRHLFLHLSSHCSPPYPKNFSVAIGPLSMLNPIKNKRFPIASSLRRSELVSFPHEKAAGSLTFRSSKSTVPRSRKNIPRKSRNVPIFLVSLISNLDNIFKALALRQLTTCQGSKMTTSRKLPWKSEANLLQPIKSLLTL